MLQDCAEFMLGREAVKSRQWSKRRRTARRLYLASLDSRGRWFAFETGRSTPGRVARGG